MPLQSPSPKPRKPKKGGLLTDRGMGKIEPAIVQSYAAQNRRVSYGKIADRANIPIDRVISILYRRQPEELGTIKALFKAFDIRLRRSDYQIQPMQADEETSQKSHPRPASLWVGREFLVTELVEQLQGHCWLLSLEGIGGIGKTALAEHLRQNPQLKQDFSLGLSLDFQRQRGGFESIARLVLGEEIAKQELLQGGETHLVAAVLAKLQFQPCLLLLDGMESLLDEERNFNSSILEQFFRGILELPELRSRLILTTRIQPQLLAAFSREKMTSIALKGLQRSTIQKLFTAWGVQLKTPADEQCLKEIAEVYEGHPLTLKMIAGEIREYPYYGNIRAYWRDYGYEYEIDAIDREIQPNGSALSSRSLSDWVKISLGRTCQRLNEIYPLAYELLCLGATNQQAVAPQGWGFLIGNFSPQEQQSALEILKRRFFLEEEKNHRMVRYYLHDFLRQIVLNHLQGSESEGERV
ncbi:MAG: NB-ARC domain-containing protein [Spirulina sp.]